MKHDLINICTMERNRRFNQRVSTENIHSDALSTRLWFPWEKAIVQQIWFGLCRSFLSNGLFRWKVAIFLELLSDLQHPVADCRAVLVDQSAIVLESNRGYPCT